MILNKPRSEYTKNYLIYIFRKIDDIFLKIRFKLTWIHEIIAIFIFF